MQEKALTIYKASAGSGKTFTLSATYIAHLLAEKDDQPHRHQLAVTFTNKATAEMKERILQYLYSIAYGDNPDDGFFKEVRKNVPKDISDEELRQKAHRELLSIIHDYDRFHVTTIDSFFQMLLSALAHELNLSATFKAEVSDKEVLGKAVARLLENLKDGSDELQWVKAFIKERMSDDKDWKISEELKRLASQITKEAYMLGSHLFRGGEGSSDSEAIDLNNKTLKDYKDLLNQIIAEQKNLVADKATALNTAIENGLTYANITNSRNVEGCIHKCMDQKASRTLRLKDIKMSATMRGHADGTKSLLTAANQKDPALCAQADALVPYFDALVQQYDQSIYITNSCELSLANLNPLRLLDAIDKEVQALNRENDRILLAYTPLLFHDLAKDTDASFVFERAGTRFHHIMIDEFQDTSSLQWSNIKELLIEDLSQGNSCMLVGDVKQGIYRFRGGDWNALANFNEGEDDELHSYNNIKTLKTNFRSGKEVVEFNNALFCSAPRVVQKCIEDVWKSAGDYDEPASPTLDSERIYPTPDKDNDNHEVTQIPHDEGGYVRIHLINNTDEKPSKKKKKDAPEEEVPQADEFNREAAVAEQMMMLHAQGVPYKEMAVLIRDKKDAAALIEYFESHHGNDSESPITLMSEEAFFLDSSPAVMTIVNALRYVGDTSNGIALEYLRRKCPAGKSMKDFEDTLKQWHDEHYSGLPFYEISSRIAEFFNLHSLKGQSPYIYCFLDSLLAYIDDHPSDVNAFLSYWDEALHRKTIPSASIDGVRILTIHKSKGLAFHSVFIPYCEWKIDKPTMAELIWTRPSQAPFNAIPLLPITMTKDAGNSIYRETYKQEVFDRYIENLNLLYVAFTRTQQNLLVWADCSKSGIAPILRDALNTKDEIIERGAPSTLKLEKEDKANEIIQASDTTSEFQSVEEAIAQLPKKDVKKNPLEFTPKPIMVDFSTSEYDAVILQSSTAQNFILPLLKAMGENAEDDNEDNKADNKNNKADNENGKADNENIDAQSKAEADAAEKAIREEYRKTGILLHNLMSTIESTSDVDLRIAEADRNGLLPPSFTTEKVRTLIKKRINHPTARQWFDGSWRLYRESSILYLKDGNPTICRPDRVMMRGNIADGTDETIVIDFKFGRYNIDHKTQVQHYMKLLTDQGLHNVRGYLWYLYTGSIEPVLPGDGDNQ